MLVSIFFVGAPVNVQSIAVIGWLFLKYFDNGLLLEWILMSAGLKEGKDGSMSVSSFLQHVWVGMKFASGPSVEVMKCMQSLMWLCMDVLLCFLQ